jgi:alpha-ketoglutarate-dependent taurine dioxygenase
VGTNIHHINEVSEDESRHLLNWFLQLIMENHDLQVRHRWANPNDVAIWDNRSMYHTATYDYEGPRQGQRAVSLGERPYFDPLSSGRREALAAEGVKA